MPVPLDPSVSVYQPEISVTLGGQEFTIPPLPASRWLAVLLDPHPDGSLILPGFLSPEDQERVDVLLFSDRLPVEELKATISEAITAASGHNWWWTMNLLSALRGEQGTYILGKMARHDPEQMPLGAWVNALYSCLIPEHAKEQDILQLDLQLDMPPVDVEAEISEADVEASSGTFFRMMQGG